MSTPIAPFRPRLSARLNYRLHRVLAPTRFTRALAGFVESRPRLRQAFTGAESAVKSEAFGCRMCGQCALPVTGYACPQTCPKQLRNGPCGGVSPTGQCEVVPSETCVWVLAYDRAAEAGHLDDLMRRHRPIDHRLAGTSSWLNYWQGRDEDLWTDPDGATVPIRRLPLAGAR